MVDIFPNHFAGKQCPDVVRTEPEFFDSNGQVFWKLKSYNDKYSLLMQGNFQNN